ncbi:uncharacterized protein [Fopius arisanus]|uniref:Protein quiver n=1 Tax=Fopius arisanus TaxID=64838 RepID=A0A9R1TSM9_9HYME|nr:PREDICTED: uncharacterized protein LOC105273875 [Fopius arisanus]
MKLVISSFALPTMAHCIMIFLVIPVIFLYTTCWGIQCYQCESLKDDSCTEHEVDPRYLLRCPVTHNYCRKIISAFYFKDSSETFVVRECAIHGSIVEDCYKGKYSKDSYQYVCECKNAEGCNSSSNFHHQNWIIEPFFKDIWKRFPVFIR